MRQIHRSECGTIFKSASPNGSECIWEINRGEHSAIPKGILMYGNNGRLRQIDRSDARTIVLRIGNTKSECTNCSDGFPVVGGGDSHDPRDTFRVFGRDRVFGIVVDQGEL